mmetsp:Transcript_134006/g.245733  ORF Transcript_134006/g.245733 Transcript_134006/m.245733 type:complete len:222 (-) Transcript_134006:54-719(-)
MYSLKLVAETSRFPRSSLTMRIDVLLLACLVCAGHTRRLSQQVQGQSYEEHVDQHEVQRQLASLLLANSPTTAFMPLGSAPVTRRQALLFMNEAKSEDVPDMSNVQPNDAMPAAEKADGQKVAEKKVKAATRIMSGPPPGAIQRGSKPGLGATLGIMGGFAGFVLLIILAEGKERQQRALSKMKPAPISDADRVLMAEMEKKEADKIARRKAKQEAREAAR